jgi:hypothetical protein
MRYCADGEIRTIRPWFAFVSPACGTDSRARRMRCVVLDLVDHSTSDHYDQHRCACCRWDVSEPGSANVELRAPAGNRGANEFDRCSDWNGNFSKSGRGRQSHTGQHDHDHGLDRTSARRLGISRIHTNRGSGGGLQHQPPQVLAQAPVHRPVQGTSSDSSRAPACSDTGT